MGGENRQGSSEDCDFISSELCLSGERVPELPRVADGLVSAGALLQPRSPQEPQQSACCSCWQHSAGGPGCRGAGWTRHDPLISTSHPVSHRLLQQDEGTLGRPRRGTGERARGDGGWVCTRPGRPRSGHCRGRGHAVGREDTPSGEGTCHPLPHRAGVVSSICFHTSPQVQNVTETVLWPQPYSAPAPTVPRPPGPLSSRPRATGPSGTVPACGLDQQGESSLTGACWVPGDSGWG